jgi:hypothetical protein
MEMEMETEEASSGALVCRVNWPRRPFESLGSRTGAGTMWQSLWILTS